MTDEKDPSPRTFNYKARDFILIKIINRGKNRRVSFALVAIGDLRGRGALVSMATLTEDNGGLGPPVVTSQWVVSPSCPLPRFIISASLRVISWTLPFCVALSVMIVFGEEKKEQFGLGLFDLRQTICTKFT
ncbi:hypothetical protein NPIL_218001 [Nephila pilipes]|uniref:Uncharacterized protein n=1 Tax=Nephila pilipes TaxID=299642 RepID=A0A8X6P2M0_NEPPI|nr:hypothetical protein NPIL_218001 [Nephila pilipes]